MNNIEHKRNVNFDKVSTHNIDKLLHKKVKSSLYTRIPTKKEIYDELKTKYKNAWKSPGYVN